MSRSAHVDTFARDHLPPRDQWPEFIFERPELQFPDRLNCARELLDRRVDAGEGASRCVVGADGTAWTYAQLREQAHRIARVLVDDLGVVPGNRVLLRGANSPMLAACWFAVVKAGAIAVGSMPLLRAKELTQIVEKAQVSHALCDARLAEELSLASPNCPTLRHVVHFGGDAPDRLEARAQAKPAAFDTVDTAADDTCIIAFTSGTTGMPKGTMHFHRDVMAACACWPRHVLRPQADDLFVGSPPLAFTFGLGGLLLFPMSVGASTLLLEKATPDALLPAIARHRATVCFSSPTAYRAMAAKAHEHDLGSLRKCVSAGEALPAATRKLWKDTTGIEMIDGIGSTELLHIFISADEAHAKPGATGVPVPGYRACIVDEQGRELPRTETGKLQRFRLRQGGA
jgi:2-aminobenzoate-CoA ligase